MFDTDLLYEAKTKDTVDDGLENGLTLLSGGTWVRILK